MVSCLFQLLIVLSAIFPSTISVEGNPLPPNCENPFGWHRVLESSRNPFFFQGRRMESLAVPLGETHPTRQLYDYSARFYNPLLSRFQQSDPTGYVDGMSLYAYAGSSPTNFTNPLGLLPWPAELRSLSTYGKKPYRSGEDKANSCGY